MKNLILFTAIILTFTSCFKSKGEIEMTYEKAIAVYGNLDEIRQRPILLGKQAIESPGKIFIGQDYILIGEKGKGIHIFNNLDMTAPERMSFIQIPFNKEFYVKGNMIYAESLYDLMKIDISDVYNPVLVSRVKNIFGNPYKNDQGESLIRFDYVVSTDKFELGSPEAKEIKKAGKIHVDYLEEIIPTSTVPSSFTSGRSTLNKIAVDYGHIYVLADDEMHVLSNYYNNVSFVKSINLGDGMETVYTENGRIFIGSERAMHIFSAANPANPTRISDYEHVKSCDPVLPYANVAYLTLRSTTNGGCNNNGIDQLVVVDITNESNPQEIESIPMDSPYGMAVVNQHLFVGQGSNGLTIFNAVFPNSIYQAVSYNNIVAYDIMRHPTDPNVILMTSDNGLEQYSIDYNSFNLTPLSTINY